MTFEENNQFGYKPNEPEETTVGSQPDTTAWTTNAAETTDAYTQTQPDMNTSAPNGYTQDGQPFYSAPESTSYGTWQQGPAAPQWGMPEPPKPLKKKHGKGGWIALLLVGCFLLGLAGSAAGTILLNSKWISNLTANQEESSSTSGSSLNTSNDSTTTPTSVTEVADATANSVVEITTESVTTGNFFQQQILTGAGSGVVITADGYIVTNNHVIEDSSKITVTLRDGTQHEAKLIGTDVQTDLAVIKIEATGLTPVVFGDSDDLKVGEQAIVIGNPLGQLGGSVTSGIISALDREITIDGQVMNLLQIDAAVNPGNSGGGLFNAKGELVGIINAKSSGEDVEGIGFAIPSNTAKKVSDELMKNGYVSGRASLGISVVQIDDAQTALMYRVDNIGVYILSVNEGSAAEKAGLQAGDRIVTINDTEVMETADLTAVLSTLNVGDQVTLTISRSGKIGTATVTLQEQSPNQSGQESTESSAA